MAPDVRKQAELEATQCAIKNANLTAKIIYANCKLPELIVGTFAVLEGQIKSARDQATTPKVQAEIDESLMALSVLLQTTFVKQIFIAECKRHLTAIAERN